MLSKRMFALLTAASFGFTLMSVGSATRAADPEWVYPTIQKYGKVVFNMIGAGDADKVNPSLDRVARAVNIFTSAGVPVSHLHFVVVIHGPATPSVLDNTHYREKFNVDNPNVKLIGELEKVGVKVVVCGQALAGQNFPHDWVDPQVEITLAAISDVIILEQEGYVFFPL